MKTYYENIAISSLGRAPAHTKWAAYASAQEAILGEGSANIVSLNGTWQFKLERCPEDVVPFVQDGADLAGFSDINVPGAWELQGFGEPIYTNVPYPWSYETQAPHMIRPSAGGAQVPDPPHVPADNPTGCYRRVFTLPVHFAGKDVFLRFDSVETAYTLWVNGKEVGYAEDSKLPSEFCVTEYVHPGENTVALQVVRFSKSIYLEDQDYWHLSGIHRNVWLIAKPQMRIEDYFITALPGGEISADITVARRHGFADHRVRLSVYSLDGTLLVQGEAAVRATAEYRMDREPTANTARIKLQLDGAKLWTPETPSLYRAVVTLIAPDGSEVDWESCRFGFKQIEVRNGVVYLNGQRLLVRGVNRHDFCWHGGRTVPREHMIEEIRQMKRMNINAVRTCHYPDDPAWYDLCDELGILLICEADLETHGLMGQLSHDPAWAMQYLERAMRMALTFKNHVSIYAWSLGNESGTGANHAAMYGFIKEYDKTRLCQYEAGEPGKNVSDVRGNMYATVEYILHMLASPTDDRPIILVEYLYQIANSGGGMDLFRELMERYPRFQGGYVWDWQDKALVGKTPDGEKYFAYGGDFGESVIEPDNPGFMTNNGLVQADLRWKPVAYEVKEAYCPVWMERPLNYSAWHTVHDDKTFVFKNRTMTEWGRDFRCEAVLRENGVEVQRFDVSLPDIAPMSQAEMTIVPAYAAKAGCEYQLEFSFSRRKDTWYAKAGEEIGCQQVLLTSGLYTLLGEETAIALGLTETETTLTVSGDHFEAVFSKETGGMMRLCKDGVEYLAAQAQPCLTRPITGLDAQPGWGWYDHAHQVDGMQPKAGKAMVYRADERVRLEFPWTMESTSGLCAKGKTSYTVTQGAVEVAFDIQLPQSLAFVSRIGMELPLCAGLEQVRSYSRGPLENYADRKLSARLQQWESTVTQQHFPFSPPSECGGHEDARWLELGGENGAKLRVESMGAPFHFDVKHHAIEDYAVRHEHQLPLRQESYLHIDAAHAPIGSEMAWSTKMPEALRVKGGAYHLAFRIKV